MADLDSYGPHEFVVDGYASHLNVAHVAEYVAAHGAFPQRYAGAYRFHVLEVHFPSGMMRARSGTPAAELVAAGLNLGHWPTETTVITTTAPPLPTTVPPPPPPRRDVEIQAQRFFDLHVEFCEALRAVSPAVVDAYIAMIVKAIGGEVATAAARPGKPSPPEHLSTP